MSSELADGARSADILVFNKGGRDIRLDRLEQGIEAPREFLYGFDHIKSAGFNARMLSSAEKDGAVPNQVIDLLERAFIRLVAAGVRPLSARSYLRSLTSGKVFISFTDGFSLSMGLSEAVRRSDRILMGGFHGLSDIENRAPAWLRPLNRAVIGAALARLDHAFFFGDADRIEAVSRYGIDEAKTSVIPFGIDTDFWRPLPDERQEDMVLAVGQDPSRDYELLVNAPGEHPTWIITSRKLGVPSGASHIRTSAGDFYTSQSLSDKGLRSAYNRACAVIVPLKNVNQPSGYSVTLQAMSCGRPVVISRIKGLWTKTLLVDGQNCLLVPPGDGRALGQAIGRLRSDKELCRRIGAAARATALSSFGLDKIGNGSVRLAEIGMRLWRNREARH